MRRRLGIDKPVFNKSKQDLIDIAKAYEEASKRVNREHGTVKIANMVIKPEPMPMPTGMIFYLDWKPKDD
jgi:hypothetical protein